MAALAAVGTLMFIFSLIFVIALYVLQGIFLSKLNKLMYGKGTALAWIPFCSTYLLGKLTINKIVGYVLVGLNLLTITITTSINGFEKKISILPQNINSVLSNLLNITIVALLIYAIVKYLQLKKEGNPAMKVADEAIVDPNMKVDMPTSPINNQIANEWMNNQNLNQGVNNMNNFNNINNYNSNLNNQAYNNFNQMPQNEPMMNNNFQNNWVNQNQYNQTNWSNQTFNNQNENNQLNNNQTDSPNRFFTQNNMNNNNSGYQDQFNASIFNQSPFPNYNNSNTFNQNESSFVNPDDAIFNQPPIFPNESIDNQSNNN